ncbi:MAG: hypothetical protein IJX62_02445, partial [Clostridia bacterium]|nr:hypothetical protein [Clostridia bacterium]
IEYFTLMSFVAVFLFFLLLFPLFYNIEKAKLSRNVDASESQGKVQLPYKKVWMFILTAAVSLYVVELFATYASQLPSTIYYPVSRGLTLISFFLLDVIAYKDKVTVKKILGLVIILIGIVFVNL